jgi:hypothetical protein
VHIIYALVNPLPGQQHTILYVGLTTNLKTRYINWLNGKEPWFRDFVTKGYIPHCSTLQIVKDRDPEKELARAKAREVYWIEYYLSLNMPLHNEYFNPHKPQPTRPVKPPLDKELLRSQIRELYADKQVPRAEILRHLGKGTQLYWIVKQTCDEIDERFEA